MTSKVRDTAQQTCSRAPKRRTPSQEEGEKYQRHHAVAEKDLLGSHETPSVDAQMLLEALWKDCSSPLEDSERRKRKKKAVK